ncbi:SIMPL domain-containing protein [Roseibium sp.]|uniref:SIMPL domain-containing protein n=1 Tax=Roseibium sp. TaxID=1936156 RepID=UPI003A9774F9
MFKSFIPFTTVTQRRSLTTRNALAVALVSLALPFAGAGALKASETSSPGSITMSGEGTASVAPDMAVVTTRVVTMAKTAPDALGQNTKAMTSVIDEIKAAGIEAKDIQTSGFSIYPRYDDRRENPSQTPEIVGYEVANGVTVQIRDLAKLGTILDTVVRSGANQVNGISFRVSNAEEKLQAARKGAVENAKAKAELYAAAAGVKLGRVLSISEAGISIPRPYAVRAEKMMMADSAPVPIETGEETLSANVTITWELSQ